MQIVVADTGPLHYLVLIREIELLPRLYHAVLVPRSVCRELDHEETPTEVRRWMTAPPPWLSIHDISRQALLTSARVAALDTGEAEALALAALAKADLILMDDRTGVAVARAEGFCVMGTLGVLDLAARRGLVDLSAAFGRLKATSFRCRKEIMAQILADHKAGRGQ